MKLSVLFLLGGTSSHLPGVAEENDENLKTVGFPASYLPSTQQKPYRLAFVLCLSSQAGMKNARGFPQFLRKGRSQYGGST
jgi:hypothetical protein